MLYKLSSHSWIDYIYCVVQNCLIIPELTILINATSRYQAVLQGPKTSDDTRDVQHGRPDDIQRRDILPVRW